MLLAMLLMGRTVRKIAETAVREVTPLDTMMTPLVKLMELIVQMTIFTTRVRTAMAGKKEKKGCPRGQLC